METPSIFFVLENWGRREKDKKCCGMRREVHGRSMRRGGARTSTLFRAAALVFAAVVLVQLASMLLLHDSLPAHSKPAPSATAKAAPAAAALLPEDSVEGKAAVAVMQTVESRGMGQTKKWLNVVSGSPHWLSPKDVSG